LYLIDTDWMADFLNGRESATHLIASLANEGIGISIVTYAELYEGIAESDERTRTRLQELLAVVDTFPIDFEVARLFGDLRTVLRREGRMIPDLDLLIAATCLRHNLTLVSRDRHFERIPSLKRR